MDPIPKKIKKSISITKKAPKKAKSQKLYFLEYYFSTTLDIVLLKNSNMNTNQIIFVCDATSQSVFLTS